MSEEEIITSPELPVDDKGVVRTAKDFSGALTLEMNDDQIKQAYQIVIDIQERYKFRPATEPVLKELGDEVVHRLASVGVLASFDPVPLAEGKPPIVEFVGAVPGSQILKYGMDHEKKQWEVRKAEERGEDFHGQKGRHA